MLLLPSSKIKGRKKQSRKRSFLVRVVCAHADQYKAEVKNPQGRVLEATHEK